MSDDDDDDTIQERLLDPNLSNLEKERIINTEVINDQDYLNDEQKVNVKEIFRLLKIRSEFINNGFIGAAILNLMDTLGVLRELYVNNEDSDDLINTDITNRLNYLNNLINTQDDENGLLRLHNAYTGGKRKNKNSRKSRKSRKTRKTRKSRKSRKSRK